MGWTRRYPRPNTYLPNNHVTASSSMQDSSVMLSVEVSELRAQLEDAEHAKLMAEREDMAA